MNNNLNNLVSNTPYVVVFLNYLLTVPFSLMKGTKGFMKLIQRDWRSETSLTVFPLSGFSVKAGTGSPILSSVHRATFHRFLSPQQVAVSTFRCCQRTRTLRSAVSTLVLHFSSKVYAAVSTVMIIRFVTKYSLQLYVDSELQRVFCTQTNLSMLST